MFFALGGCHYDVLAYLHFHFFNSPFLGIGVFVFIALAVAADFLCSAHPEGSLINLKTIHGLHDNIRKLYREIGVVCLF